VCAIGLTDSPSRYVIINEPKETDPLTLTHSYWPPSLPRSLPLSLLHAAPPSIPFALRVRSDRVHPGMVNKSLSRTATTTGGVMGRVDLLSLSFPVRPSLVSRYSNYSTCEKVKHFLTRLVGIAAVTCSPLRFLFPRILNIQGQFNHKHHSPQPSLAHPVIRKPNYYHAAPLDLPRCLCQATVRALGAAQHVQTITNDLRQLEEIRPNKGLKLPEVSFCPPVEQ